MDIAGISILATMGILCITVAVSLIIDKFRKPKN